MRRDRPRITFTVPELLTVLVLVLYGVGTLGFAIFGPAFFAWLVVVVALCAPFVLVSTRRRRRRLARMRAARRRARVAAYPDPWLEWEKAA